MMIRSEEVADSPDRATAMFAAGCFWGVEAAFRRRLGEGVIETTVGYAGGHTQFPTYKEVCRGDTGHAEVVRVVYDPSEISFDELLAIFWDCHDPTQRNRQGPDVGTQYRSAIFYHDDEQKQRAEASKQALEQSGRHKRPVVTELSPAGPFWEAEAYHQRYLEKHGQAACPTNPGAGSDD